MTAKGQYRYTVSVFRNAMGLPEGDLQALANSLEQKSLLFDGKRIGSVLSARVEGDRIVATFGIDYGHMVPPVRAIPGDEGQLQLLTGAEATLVDDAAG